MKTTGFILDLITRGGVECSDELREQYVQKARHLLRDEEGKFRRMNDHENNIPDDSGPLPTVHSGAVLPALRRALGLS